MALDPLPQPPASLISQQDPIEEAPDPVDVKPEGKEWITPGMLRRDSVNLLIGASGAGKTAVMFQWLESWHKGQPLWNILPENIASGYVCLDHTQDGTESRLRHFGYECLDHSSLLTGPFSLQSLEPLPELLLVDGFARLVPGSRMNDYGAVADFLTDCQTWCEKTHHTLIGSVPTAKSLDGEPQRGNIRERASGSVAWGAFTEVVWLIEQGADPRTRILQQSSPYGQPRAWELMFKDGRLEPLQIAKAIEPVPDRILDWLKQRETFSLQEFADFIVMPKATASRALHRIIEAGYARKVRHGIYMTVLPN
ncbi:MAG: AAA family ATPase [Terriglobia bacterium]